MWAGGGDLELDLSMRRLEKGSQSILYAIHLELRWRENGTGYSLGRGRRSRPERFHE